jgi:hypothetical protein
MRTSTGISFRLIDHVACSNPAHLPQWRIAGFDDAVYPKSTVFKGRMAVKVSAIGSRMPMQLWLSLGVCSESHSRNHWGMKRVNLLRSRTFCQDERSCIIAMNVTATSQHSVHHQLLPDPSPSPVSGTRGSAPTVLDWRPLQMLAQSSRIGELVGIASVRHRAAPDNVDRPYDLPSGE